jgi:pimeloyl-ACP methyl ester carboxylesterase
VLGQLGFNILSTLKLNGFENNAIITEAWIDAYAAPFAAPADCLGAIGWAKGFATNAHRFETPDPAAERAIRGKPALAIWGEADRTLQADHFLPLFSALFPASPIERLAGVGHYCTEDAPDVIAALILEFLRQT